MTLIVREAWRDLDLAVSGKDFYSVLKPVTWFCRIAGIFPLKLKGPVGKRRYSTSYAAIIYTMTIFVLIITALSISVKDNNERVAKLTNHAVVAVSKYFELPLQMVSLTIIIVAAIQSKDKFANALHTLSLQDIPLRKLGTKINYAAEYKQNCIQSGIIISIFIALCTYDFMYQLNFNLHHLLNWTAWMWPNIIRISSACLFVDIVFVLKQRFTALNEHLKEMIEELKYSVPETLSSGNGITEKVRSIAMIHGVLCESALRVNQTFGLNIIVGVVYALITLTTTMYFLFQDIKAPNRSYLHLFGSINWGIMNCMHLVYIVTVCHLAQNEAHVTGKLIHKFELRGIDSPLTNVIQSFSLQLHHEKVEFSGAGLFPLDATLIQSIVGAVTTYLVIIIQFDTSLPQPTDLKSGNISLT